MLKMTFSSRALRLCALLIPLTAAFAQQPVSRHLISPQQEIVVATRPIVGLRLHPSDTGRVTLEGTSVDVSTIPQEKSTGLAMLLSAVVPGAGQVYTERYISVPIIWGFGTYFGKTVLDNDESYKDFRGQFAASVAADTVAGVGDAHLKSVRDFYRDQRDRFAVYLGLTYLLNIVDAYVGAALYGFDVSPDLSGGAQVRYRVEF